MGRNLSFSLLVSMGLSTNHLRCFFLHGLSKIGTVSMKNEN